MASVLRTGQKALEIKRKILGEDHPGTTINYNNVAMNLTNLGRHAEALQYKQKALEIRKKTPERFKHMIGKLKEGL